MSQIIFVISVVVCLCLSRGTHATADGESRIPSGTCAREIRPRDCPSLDTGDQKNVCYTPQGKAGVCVAMRCCPQLSELARPPISTWNKTYIISSKCDGPMKHSICCGPPPEYPKKLSPRQMSDLCKQQTAFPPDFTSGCCGVTGGLEDKISGGEAADILDYPWLALIEYSKGPGQKKFLGCGGALISGKYVLTAGHCVSGSILENGTPENVRLGEYDTATNPDTVRTPGNGTETTDKILTIPIEEIIVHPKYDPDSPYKRHDIALIRLKEKAKYTFFIRPICLPRADVKTLPNLDKSLFIAGWGAINETQTKSNIKMFASVPYVSLDKCQPSYTAASNREVKLSSVAHICAGGEKGKDACHGDSGGPLMYEQREPNLGNIFEAVGIVSFGVTHCSSHSVPGVYTNVYTYTGWIRSNIRP